MLNSHSAVPKDHVQTKFKPSNMLGRIHQSLINAGAQAVLKASDALHAIFGAPDGDSSEFAPLLPATSKLGTKFFSRTKTERTNRLRANQDAHWTQECAAPEKRACSPREELYRQLNNMFQLDLHEEECFNHPTWKQHDGIVYKQGPCRQVQVHRAAPHAAQSQTAIFEYAPEADQEDADGMTVSGHGEFEQAHSSELAARENMIFELFRTPSGSSSSTVRRRGAVRYSRNPLFYRQAVNLHQGSRQDEEPLLGSEDNWILQYVSESDSDSDGEMTGLFNSS